MNSECGLKRRIKRDKNKLADDKQYLRDWLTKIGFRDKVKQASEDGTKPIPPELPTNVVNELLKRYKVRL